TPPETPARAAPPHSLLVAPPLSLLSPVQTDIGSGYIGSGLSSTSGLMQLAQQQAMRDAQMRDHHLELAELRARLASADDAYENLRREMRELEMRSRRGGASVDYVKCLVLQLLQCLVLQLLQMDEKNHADLFPALATCLQLNEDEGGAEGSEWPQSRVELEQSQQALLKELEARALADGVAFGALLNQVRELEAGEALTKLEASALRAEYMETEDHHSMFPVVATLLHLTASEVTTVARAREERASQRVSKGWFG
ncbi:hypothetical protein Ctob_000882, partial [Chrysochromulina tobinii]